MASACGSDKNSGSGATTTAASSATTAAATTTSAGGATTTGGGATTTSGGSTSTSGGATSSVPDKLSGSITIGSANFNEQELVAEMVSQVLASKGVDVTKKF